MYTPNDFRENRMDEIQHILENHPLGALVTYSRDGLDATHLPFFYESKPASHRTLKAHVARANPLWKNHNESDVLVIFRANDAYISPNWYPSKHEFHNQVPTWDYQVLHIHGTLRIREDAEFIRNTMENLTLLHELKAGESTAWKISDADPELIESMIRATVGIEIEIERIEAISKLSQNKQERDRKGVIVKLEKRGLHSVSEAIQRAAHGSGTLKE